MNVSNVLKAAAGYWAAYLALFLVLFPLVSPTLLWVLEHALGFLTHFGEGWR